MHRLQGVFTQSPELGNEERSGRNASRFRTLSKGREEREGGWISKALIEEYGEVV